MIERYITKLNNARPPVGEMIISDGDWYIRTKSEGERLEDRLMGVGLEYSKVLREYLCNPEGDRVEPYTHVWVETADYQEWIGIEAGEGQIFEKLNRRVCNCGSGFYWAQCPMNTQECG